MKARSFLGVGSRRRPNRFDMVLESAEERETWLTKQFQKAVRLPRRTRSLISFQLAEGGSFSVDLDIETVSFFNQAADKAEALFQQDQLSSRVRRDMEPADIQAALTAALDDLNRLDRHLLQYDLSERCITSRLALYLQPRFPGDSVDVEYNRSGDTPKRLGVRDECANFRDRNGEALVVPDLIVHRRGPDGPNILVVELKKTINADGLDCDRQRVRAFMQAPYRYRCGALVVCETRADHEPRAHLSEWYAA